MNFITYYICQNVHYKTEHTCNGVSCNVFHSISTDICECVCVCTVYTMTLRVSRGGCRLRTMAEEILNLCKWQTMIIYHKVTLHFCFTFSDTVRSWYYLSKILLQVCLQTLKKREQELFTLKWRTKKNFPMSALGLLPVDMSRWETSIMPDTQPKSGW